MLSIFKILLGKEPRLDPVRDCQLAALPICRFSDTSPFRGHRLSTFSAFRNKLCQRALIRNHWQTVQNIAGADFVLSTGKHSSTNKTH